MAQERMNPASRVAGRALEMFSLAAVNIPEHIESAPALQHLRAAYVARKFNVSRNVAEVLAPLAFGREAAQ
jgi:hypothetical protein